MVQARRAGLPIKPPSIARFATIAALVPLAVALLLAWLHADYLRAEQLRAQTTRSFERSLAQISLLSRLKDAETGQRGYMLTGKPSFLQPYYPAVAAIRQQLADEQAAADPNLSRGQIRAVTRLFDRKLAELDQTIRLFDAGSPAAARMLVSQSDGNAVMAQLRQVIGRMVAEERARTHQRREAFAMQRAALRRTVLAVVAILTVLLFLFLAFAWRLRQLRYRSLLEAFEAAERNSAILDSTVDAILILNPSGTIEMINAAATSMLGYAPAELERRDIALVVRLEEEGSSFHQRIGLEDGELRHSFLPDRTAVRRDGQPLPVDVAMGVMRLPSGDHLVLSLRDASERKRIETVKDELISTVSHELRTPLTSIVGSLGLLREGAAGPMNPQTRRLVDIAENNSRRLIRLINDVLDIDRIESGTLEMQRLPLDLRDVLERAGLGSEGLTRSRGIALWCDTPLRPVLVQGDADRLLQVVTNLISNAASVAPPGSAIDISLTRCDGRAVIRVEDRGPGVPHAFRSRIFGRFEQAESGNGGTGLGLAISREIVLKHDGAIWFEDREGGGTTFAISLPLFSETVQGGTRQPRVLICEADGDATRDLAAIAAAAGCAFDTATSADEAWEALGGHSYVALLVGLSLPPDGGPAFAQAVRASDPRGNIPIIVTASPKGSGTGPTPFDMVDWVKKSGDPDRLDLALRRALSRSDSSRPLILHLDDDRDLLDVVATGIEPEAEIVSATTLDAARALLRSRSPDVAILDMQLARGFGPDLIPFLVDGDGLAIPIIIFSAQDVPPDLAQRVDAVLVKARGSLPDLKATIHRVVRARQEGR